MENNNELAMFKAILKRRKKWLFLPLALLVSSTVVVAFLLPSIYRSSSTILIQYPQIPSNLVLSTVNTYADQRIQSIAQEVTARSKILNLVQKFDLLPLKRDRLTAEELVEEIQDRITIEPIEAQIKKDTENRPVPLTIAFRLSYDDENPKKAQLVANDISSYFLQKNLESREKHARSTTKFLEEQLRHAKTRFDELEEKLAVYRQAHLEELPEFTTLNAQKVEKLNSDISNLNLQIRSSDEQRSVLRTKLAAMDPYSSSKERVISVEERLQQAQLERASLSSRYSENHPLMQAKKQEIELLQGRGKESQQLAGTRERLQQLEIKLSNLKGRYADEHPAIRSTRQEIEGVKKEIAALQSKKVQPRADAMKDATNPTYVGLSTELEKIGAAVGAMKEERANLEKEIKKVYAKLHSMPQVSREYNELLTDYQNARNHYNELQQKSSAALVAQGMEEEQLGETFQVIEPPFLPEKPVRPNRLVIVLIGLVLGVGLSAGGSFLREYSDDSVHDAKTLIELTGITVFSVIPKILTDQDKSRIRKKRICIAAGTVGALFLVSGIFHLFVTDLYIVYSRMIRLIAKNLPI